MKIKKSRVVKIITYILFFFMSAYSCFYLYSVSGITNNDYRFTCLIGFFLLVWLTKDKRKSIWNMSHEYRKYLVLTILSVMALAFFTTVKYPSQSLQLTVRVISQYLIVAWAAPIFYIMKKNGTEYKVLDIVCAISVVWCGLVSLQSLYYSYTGGSLFSFIDRINVGIRNENLRITVGPFANFAIVYCFWKLYFGKIRRNILYLISLIILLLANIFVQQSRAGTIVIVITIVVMILMEKNSTYSIVKKGIIVTGIVLFADLSDYIQNYVVDIFTKYEISVIGRTYAYSYFWNVFKSNPIFGFGFVKSSEAYGSVLHGPLGMAYTDDVGFVGQLAALGIFSIIVVFGIYIMLMKQIVKIRKQTGCWDCLLVGAYVYLIASSFTLIVFDQQRICLLPIIVALFEFRASRYDVNRMPKIDNTSN